jgi:hypothetical protein
MTSKATYLGALRTVSIDLQSANEIISDAPLDNNGDGEAFLATDTVGEYFGKLYDQSCGN